MRADAKTAPARAGAVAPGAEGHCFGRAAGTVRLWTRSLSRP